MPGIHKQNGVAERKNRTLIEAARTMLADSFLPNTFWAEAVSTACYVLNRQVDKEDQVFLDELERLRSKEQKNRMLIDAELKLSEGNLPKKLRISLLQARRC
ncbi:hypothetical protein Tco_0397609 [Tanacetum coccineum]|uniref:Ribonuclease H-like domain-containing protein n=1 Tax=Tanacetum coccineum TaxID=301880 RepID=A0ABQ5EPK3_9ASTR